jgi:hypothetical protein
MANSSHKCVNGVKIPEADIMLEKGDIIYLSNNIHDKLTKQNSDDIKEYDIKCIVHENDIYSRVELDIIKHEMYGNITKTKLYGEIFYKTHYRRKVLYFRNDDDNREYIVYSDCSKNAEKRNAEKRLAEEDFVREQLRLIKDDLPKLRKPNKNHPSYGVVGPLFMTSGIVKTILAATQSGGAHRRINKTKRMRSKGKHSRKVRH